MDSVGIDLTDFKELQSTEDSRDISVSSVMAVLDVLEDPSEVPSTEFSVARLCFDGVRNSVLVGRFGALEPGLKVCGLGGCAWDGVHRRPRNLEAAD